MALTILYAVVIISCIIVVLRENRNPIRSLSWVIALIFLPFVGFIFYMFFGRSLKGMHLISRRNRRKLLHKVHHTKVNLAETNLSQEEQSLVKLAFSTGKSVLTLNNKIDIFTSGEQKFESLISDLKRAEKSIFLQYYIFTDDRLGNEIADILIEKARSGVKVYVIYDNVGSFSSSSGFFKRLREGGVDVHPFFRVTFPQLANRINWRNHRKIVVIDNSIGYIGGMNIAERYLYDTPDGKAWRDTHFRVEGDIVESLMYSFAIDWNFLNKASHSLPLDYTPTDISNQVGMQLVTSGPADHWDNLTLAFLKAILMATKAVYIQTPYFLPPDSLLHALESAALAKVDVRVMIPSKSDSRLLQYASFSYVTQCLKAGIKVYTYDPGMLHSKMMIVDNKFATVGSTNFDFRSFENNFECNLMIYDAETNRRLRDVYFEDLSHCHKLTLSEWKKRPLFHRFMESIVRLFSPIL